MDYLVSLCPEFESRVVVIVNVPSFLLTHFFNLNFQENLFLTLTIPMIISVSIFVLYLTWPTSLEYPAFVSLGNFRTI